MNDISLIDLESYDIDHATNCGALWDALESKVLYVVDENGVNMGNAQVRHLLGKHWLYVDDQDGFSILHEDRVADLSLVSEDPRRGYSLTGEVIDL